MVRTRHLYATVMLRGGAQVLFRMEEPMAYKNSEGQWYRAQDVHTDVRKSMNMYFLRGGIFPNGVIYATRQQIKEMVEAI